MGRFGFFSRLKSLHRLGLGRRLSFVRLRPGRLFFFDVFIRDGGFGRIGRLRGGLFAVPDGRQRFGVLSRLQV
jgi:hypothetical protein